jgi:hypothetical protein
MTTMLFQPLVPLTAMVTSMVGMQSHCAFDVDDPDSMPEELFASLA